jgi:hypothetical protein
VSLSRGPQSVAESVLGNIGAGVAVHAAAGIRGGSRPLAGRTIAARGLHLVAHEAIEHRHSVAAGITAAGVAALRPRGSEGGSARIGALSKAGAVGAVALCSERFCTLHGAGLSKPPTRGAGGIGSSPCFRPNGRCPRMPRTLGCRCGSMRWSCIGRASGGRAGSPVISMSNCSSIGSLRCCCRIRARAPAGNTSYRRWCAIG